MGERQLEGRTQRRRKSGQVRVVRRQCKSSCLLSWKEERAVPRAADRAAGLSGISAGAEGLNIADTLRDVSNCPLTCRVLTQTGRSLRLIITVISLSHGDGSSVPHRCWI